MEEKELLIGSILDLELEMFLAVQSAEPASCQQQPERFRNMRKAQFSTWSGNTLESYLQDLKGAVQEGKNLMTLKYARMDNLVPPLTSNPLVEKIASIQLDWQREMAVQYPKIMGRGRSLEDGSEVLGGGSFKVYLMGELETYSDQTLELLFADVRNYLENKKNMTQEIYDHMVRDLGFSSLEEAESHQS